MIVCVSALECTSVSKHMENSEDNLQEPVLSFYLVGLEDQTQAIRFCSKCLFMLSGHASPQTRLKDEEGEA